MRSAKSTTPTRATGTSRTGLTGDSLGHLAGALKKQWKRYRKELKRCQDKFSEKAIHDSRVETRRLLATVELLCDFMPAGKVKKIECALKDHLDSFDDLRDTQVQLQLTGKLRRNFALARRFHGYLVEREARFARRTRRRIKKVKTGRLGKLIRQCLKEVENQWKACGREKANGRLRSTMDRAFTRAKHQRAQIDPRDTRTIHCARVAFKRFRYMVEALADCIPSADEQRLEAMHDYQTLMGDIQDAQVLLTAVDKYLCKHEIEPKAALRFRKELLRRRQVLIRRYLNAAYELAQYWPG